MGKGAGAIPYGNLLRCSGLAGIAAGIFLLLFWFLTPVLLPMDQVPHNYVQVVLDPDWVRVNLLAVGAPLFGFGVLLGPWMTLARSVGAALYAAGMARLGWALWTGPVGGPGIPLQPPGG